MKSKSVEGEWIWGLHSVELCLEFHPELILQIFCSPQSLAPSVRERAGSIGLKVQESTRPPVPVQDKRHQGVWAELKHFPKLWWKNFDASVSVERGQWVFLDRIQDPRNFGAILRSCAAFGVQAVFVRDRHQAPLTGTVAQSSAGQMFRVPIVEVQSMEAFWKWVENWFVTPLALELGAAPPSEVLPKLGSGRILWLLGSEGSGLSEGLRSHAQIGVSLPMAAGVESLNASVAASLALYEGATRLRIPGIFNK